MALAVVAVAIAVLAVVLAVGQRKPRLAEPNGYRRFDPAVIDPRALRDVAVIRYDALQEMSGQLSFSMALLNAQGDGVVISSINSRAETRTYAKAVVGGKGAQEVSPEEEEAIRVAQAGYGPDGPSHPGDRPKITGQTGARGAAAFS